MNSPYPDSKQPDSLEDGLEFQDFVLEQLHERLRLTISLYTSRRYQYARGETLQGVEIKLDRRCTEFSRLSIETAEKTRADQPEFSASGICRGDNTWLYVQGNREILFVFAKSTLRILHSLRLSDGKWRFQRKEEPTLQAFYLPFQDATTYAATVLDFRYKIVPRRDGTP